MCPPIRWQELAFSIAIEKVNGISVLWVIYWRAPLTVGGEGARRLRISSWTPGGHRRSGRCRCYCRQLTRSLHIWFVPCANNDINVSFGIHRLNGWYICTWEGLIWGKVNMPPEGSEWNRLIFVCKRQVTRIQQLTQLNSTHVCLQTHLMAWFTDGFYQFGAGKAWWESAERSWYKIALRKCLLSAVVLGTEHTWGSETTT